MSDEKLIKCKDCKYWGGHMHFAYKNAKECVVLQRITFPHDFCSYAKKEDKNEHMEKP